jgi:hypothetical protein
MIIMYTKALACLCFFVEFAENWLYSRIFSVGRNVIVAKKKGSFRSP